MLTSCKLSTIDAQLLSTVSYFLFFSLFGCQQKCQCSSLWADFKLSWLTFVEGCSDMLLVHFLVPELTSVTVVCASPICLTDAPVALHMGLSPSCSHPRQPTPCSCPCLLTAQPACRAFQQHCSQCFSSSSSSFL